MRSALARPSAARMPMLHSERVLRSMPFLNQIEQGKPTAQIGKVLEVCRRHGIEVVFRLPAQSDRAGE